MSLSSKYSQNVIALLGPTNTGKTHFAIERMLSHKSGMIGLPLRLLAREVYDRITALKGLESVALITGEEKLVPDQPKYFVCTIEAMPLEKSIHCLVIDEIQLAADRDRGHTFTQRILNARGTAETIFLGAETMRPILKQLVPYARLVQRERLSKLTHSGYQKLSKLPPRSAVITFSAQQVYEQAEAMRAHRGGCVVVLGALSPRTRNAQIELYQSGEVDYMVATDAIGMGLNMELEHVAFASNTKFDGHKSRLLFPSEIGQIAGRAGRYKINGTFGTTGQVKPFNQGISEAVEKHLFPSIRQLYWRNDQLDKSSLEGLIHSLNKPPPYQLLKRKGDAYDHVTLASLASNIEIQKRANNSKNLDLLWKTCQIPDFTKTLPENHVSLVSKIYTHLCDGGTLPNSWVTGLVSRLDRIDGDIDTLTARISHIRTWTYIAHQKNWLDNTSGWQQRTRAIEDRLSDALHERLTQRFVDKRASIFSKGVGKGKELLTSVKNNGEVIVEGYRVGNFCGLQFKPDPEIATSPSIIKSVRRLLISEIIQRTSLIESSTDECFCLGLGHNNQPWSTIAWNGTPIARLKRGESIMKPDLIILPAEELGGENERRIRIRLNTWVQKEIRTSLSHLFKLKNDSFTGSTRGVVFQLIENLGFVPETKTDSAAHNLNKANRLKLKQYGVKFGLLGIYLPQIVKYETRLLTALLWWVFNHKEGIPPLISQAAYSIPYSSKMPHAFLNAIGFKLLGKRVIRIDIAERIAFTVHKRSLRGSVVIDKYILGMMACPVNECPSIMRALGYRKVSSTSSVIHFKALRKNKKVNNVHSDYSDSPFYALKNNFTKDTI